MLAPALLVSLFLGQTHHVPEAVEDRAAYLLKECRSVAKLNEDNHANTDAVYAAHCIGYIEGELDGLNGAGVLGNKVCIGPHTTGTLAQVFITFMDKNPKLWDMDKAEAVFASMLDAYPCPAK
jgi:hypothetical protein